MNIILSAIPSPSQGVWYISIPIRAYALAIICGIVLAVLITRKRYIARGGRLDDLYDVVLWAVPAGIIGGRLYHVISDNELYFRPDRNPWDALKIWNGGLGIWGAIALGAVAVYLVLRKKGRPMAPFADAAAPGLLVAQAVGRLGNWFNQELYGAPTTLPWGLQIDNPAGYPPGTTFHPTFLYELIWCLLAAVLLIVAEKRFDFKGGMSFWFYVMAYTSGRVWIEMLRIDPANHIFGLRLNVWTSILIFALAFLCFRISKRRVAPAVLDSVAADETEASQK